MDAEPSPETQQLVQRVRARSEPWASPLFGNLDGLPPIHLVVGSSEMMLDEAGAIKQRGNQ